MKQQDSYSATKILLNKRAVTRQALMTSNPVALSHLIMLMFPTLI